MYTYVVGGVDLRLLGVVAAPALAPAVSRDLPQGQTAVGAGAARGHGQGPLVRPGEGANIPPRS